MTHRDKTSTATSTLAQRYARSSGKSGTRAEREVTRFLDWLSEQLPETEITSLLEQALADEEGATPRNHREDVGRDVRPPGVRDLELWLDVWGLSKAEGGRIFGVSRQAFSKWLEAGVPEDRRPAVATLGAATDLLLRHLRRERIPAVVRRPAPAREGLSLVDVARQRGSDAVLQACREMFAFEDANAPPVDAGDVESTAASA